MIPEYTVSKLVCDRFRYYLQQYRSYNRTDFCWNGLIDFAYRMTYEEAKNAEVNLSRQYPHETFEIKIIRG